VAAEFPLITFRGSFLIITPDC